ncbi:MAG: ribonuclease P protein component [Bosea sp. (in: a-proteobacteria)]
MRPDRPIRLSRLKQRKDFLAAAAHGRRFRSSAFSVQVRDAAPEEGQDGLRLGLTASRKTGNSVKRNRIRRRLRAAAAIALGPQSGRACDIVVVARPETLTAPFEHLVADLSVALDRARPAKPGPSSRDRRRPPVRGEAPVQP